MSASFAREESIAGSGIFIPEPDRIDDKAHEDFLRANMPHYIYFPLGAPPNEDGALDVSDRRLAVKKILRGRIMILKNIDYVERNQTEAAMNKENPDDVPEEVRWVKNARLQAEEVSTAYPYRGLKTLESVSGAPAKLVADIEGIIMPKLPDTLVKIIAELENESPRRIAAIEDKALRDKATEVYFEMKAAADEGWFYADSYLNDTETEQVGRAQPSGVGKAKLDKADRYYYAQLERTPAHAAGVITSQATKAGQSAMAATAAQAAPSAPTEEMKDCPRCYEQIKARAYYCRYCDLDIRAFEVASNEEKKAKK